MLIRDAVRIRSIFGFHQNANIWCQSDAEIGEPGQILSRLAFSHFFNIFFVEKSALNFLN